MRCRRPSDGHIVSFHSGALVGHGGEALIYAVQQDPTLVAKVYHEPTAARAAKLRAMLANPPDDPMRAKGHASIAWPTDLLCGEFAPQVVGFLMPRVTGVHPIIDFYNPRTRRQVCPLFNYRYLHQAARNLAAAMGALHARGIVIGDVNESNILVNDRSLVTLVDCDSFQVPDPQTGRPHRCPVGKPEFTPPELQGKTFALVDRSVAHDRFGLAVLIYQLLMEGLHPYAGRYLGRGDPPPYEERISSGHFPHGTGRAPYQPQATALPFTTLAPSLQGLFVSCFEEGHRHPSARPEPETWVRALNEASAELRRCSANDQHWFGPHLSACPWCGRRKLLAGRDPFPSAEQAGLPPPPVVRPTAWPHPRPAPRPAPGPRPTPAPSPTWAARHKRKLIAAGAWAAILLLAIVIAALSGPSNTGPGEPVARKVATSKAATSEEPVVKKAVPAPPVTPEPVAKKAVSAVEAADAHRVRADATRKLGASAETIHIGGATSLDLVLIPAGTFRMGSESGGDSDERPVRQVAIARPFYMGRTEVTQRQWEAVMGSNPSNFKGQENPVEQVSWHACQEFIKKLNERTGRRFALPSEAEWEYACRAGSTTAFSFGENEVDLGEYAWYSSNSNHRTQPVGRKKPNAWGLYDMHGNVWEWCEDVWHGNYQGAPSDGAPWLTGGDQGARVVRGGSWCDGPGGCRSAYRNRSNPRNGGTSSAAGLSCETFDYRLVFYSFTVFRSSPARRAGPKFSGILPSMATRPELSVITKAYDFALWLIQRLDKFPRNRKFTLGDHLERGALDLLRLLIKAKYSRAPRAELGEANLLLQQMRFLVRLAKDLRCLAINSYEFAAQQIDGIGAEIGGWLKSCPGEGKGARA